MIELLGWPLGLANRREVEQDIASARGAKGGQAYVADREEGLETDMDEAVAYALTPSACPSDLGVLPEPNRATWARRARSRRLRPLPGGHRARP